VPTDRPDTEGWWRGSGRSQDESNGEPNENGRANFHDGCGQKNAENDVANIRENKGIRDARRLRHASFHLNGRCILNVSAGLN
jgi:hypothetical protein